ncbi:MAG: hypothetical protein H6835_20090 [Planctomycetes bacterium]|nr:hypothetical protein [Planctomycetota bacterium]
MWLNITSPGLVTMETITGATSGAGEHRHEGSTADLTTRLVDDEARCWLLSLLSYNVTTPGT